MLTRCTLALLLVLPAAADDKKVAMVLAVKGTVTVQTKAGEKRPARLMDLLSLLCAPNSVGHARQFSRLR